MPRPLARSRTDGQVASVHPRAAHTSTPGKTNRDSGSRQSDLTGRIKEGPSRLSKFNGFYMDVLLSPPGRLVRNFVSEPTTTARASHLLCRLFSCRVNPQSSSHPPSHPPLLFPIFVPGSFSETNDIFWDGSRRQGAREGQRESERVSECEKEEKEEGH